MEDDRFYYYLELKKRGADYSEIRKLMREEGFDENEIRSAIDEIDSENVAAMSGNASIFNPKFVFGIVLILVGLIWVLFSRIGILPLLHISAGLTLLSSDRRSRSRFTNNSNWRRK